MMTRQRDIDQRQADALTELVASIRLDWDKAGIRKGLSDAVPKSGHSFVRLTIAAVKAAERASNLTPAVIALDGPHWQTGVDVEPARARFCDRCGTSHVPGTCPDPEPPRYGARNPQRQADVLAELRAAVRPTKAVDREAEAARAANHTEEAS